MKYANVWLQRTGIDSRDQTRYRGTAAFTYEQTAEDACCPEAAGVTSAHIVGFSDKPSLGLLLLTRLLRYCCLRVYWRKILSLDTLGDMTCSMKVSRVFLKLGG